MRDIRNDLQERARFIEEEIGAIQAQYDKMAEQLKAERDARVGELKAEFTALGKLMEAEHRRMAEILSLQNPTPAQAPQMSLADFIMQRLTEIGPMSKEALVNLALREGLFADVESADRAVHGTLVHIIRSEHLRQLHDGTFVPNTPPQALRLRRA
jgi:acyl transferase domain-containing protein